MISGECMIFHVATLEATVKNPSQPCLSVHPLKVVKKEIEGAIFEELQRRVQKRKMKARIDTQLFDLYDIALSAKGCRGRSVHLVVAYLTQIQEFLMPNSVESQCEN